MTYRGMKGKLNELNELNEDKQVYFPWCDFQSSLKEIAKNCEDVELKSIFKLLATLDSGS